MRSTPPARLFTEGPTRGDGTACSETPMTVPSGRWGGAAGIVAPAGPPFPALLVPTPFRPASSLTGPLPRGCLFPPVPGIFPWLERRFLPGEMTVLQGPSSSVRGFLPFLLAAVVAQGGTVSLRDGARGFAPYEVGALARRWGSPVAEALARIRVARAFTVHQLVTLMETWGEEEAAASPPSDLLVAHEPFALFHDPDVQEYERAALLPHLDRVTARLLRSTKRPLLRVRYDMGADEPVADGPGPRPWETLRLVPRREGGVVLEATRSREALDLVALAAHQRPLEDFDDVGATAGGIQRWDARSPPTA